MIHTILNANEKKCLDSEAPKTKRGVIAWVESKLNKPAFPISPQQSLLNNKEAKQPAFYDGRYYKTLNWKSYQSWHELEPNLRQQLREKWHSDERIEGVSSLGGFNGEHWLGWLDFDLSDFGSATNMEQEIADWQEKYPIIEQAPHFTTPSGGHRFLVAWSSEPTDFGANNGFSLTPNSTERMGELLTKNGGHTLLPPTVGTNGQAYEWVNFAEYPPVISSPSAIGIYPLARKTQTETTKSTYQTTSSQWSKYLAQFEYKSIEAVPLDCAIAPSHRELISTGVVEGSRDNTAAALARDLVGTENYLRAQRQRIEGTASELLREFCARCSPSLSDFERVRILSSAQKSNPQPSLDEYKIKACVAGYFWKRGDKQLFSKPSKNANSTSERQNQTDKPLTMEEGAHQARIVLIRGGSELAVNFELERIRRLTDLSSSFWERKVIAPLKRELGGERFKADLKLILQEEDKIEQLLQIAQLASRYQMSSATVKSTLELMKHQIVTKEVEALTLTELFALESAGLNWLVPGLIPVGETLILAGPPKVGKTLLAYDLAFGVATGEDDVLGQALAGGKKVLIVECDESAQSTKVKLLRRGFRERDERLVKVLPSWNISQLPLLEAQLEDFRPALVIIDSLRRINHGSEVSENSAEFADNIYTLKETLQRYGASGLLIHHSNKDADAMGVNKLRGSSAIAGAVWGTITLDHIPQPDPNNKKKLIIDPREPKRVLNLHARDAEGQSLQIELNPENNSWSVLGEVGVDESNQAIRESLKARILNVLHLNPSGLGGRDLIECLDDPTINNHSVYTTLNRLVNQKIISSKPAPGDRRYTIYYLPPTEVVIENEIIVEENINTPQESYDPLSRPDCVSNEVQSAETYNSSSVRDTQQLDNIRQQLDNKNEMLSDLQFVANDCILETTVDVEIDNSNSEIDNIEKGRCGEPKNILGTEVIQTELIDNELEIEEQEKESERLEWDFSDVIDGIDSEMVRLGWNQADGMNYLEANYGVKSRQYLSDEQLVEFWYYLKCQG